MTANLGEYVPATDKKGRPYNKYTGITPHDFRRSAVRSMMRKGVGEKVAMTISGHKTRDIFDRYNIVDTADVAEAARKIAANEQHSAIPATHTKLKHHGAKPS